jgi:Protein of unknown function (DUF2924)
VILLFAHDRLELPAKQSVNGVGSVGGVAMPKSQDTYCVGHLHHLNKIQILELWRDLFKNEPPLEMRHDLMLRMVAQGLQEQEFGALREPAIRGLRNLTNNIATNRSSSTSIRSPIKSGTRMVRQWKDQVHVVNVEGKRFEYRGDQYKSLSEIARLITGTRWSGPLFFGVKQNNQSVVAQ